MFSWMFTFKLSCPSRNYTNPKGILSKRATSLPASLYNKAEAAFHTGPACQLHVSPTWPCARGTDVSVQSLYWNCFQSFLISPKAELILLVLLPFLCSSWRKQLIYQMPETTLSESGMNQKKIERMSSVNVIRAHFWPYIGAQPACPWKKWSHGHLLSLF